MKIFVGVCFVLLIVGVILLIIKNKIILNENNCLICENEKIHDELEEIKSMKHDLCNIIQSIGGFAQTNDLEGIKDMYNSIIEECTYIKSIENIERTKIKNPAIYNLINVKYKLARTKNIKFYIDINTDTNNINIKNFELCRIIGILIDNAIEAAQMCEEKIVNVKFYYDGLNKRNIIVVENTYSKLDIDINKIFENGYTSKKEKLNHGLGLWKVKQIVNLHNNLILYSTKGNFFKQKLEIYD